MAKCPERNVVEKSRRFDDDNQGMKITDALIAEHRMFLEMFNFIEESLASAQTVSEAHALARMVARLLESHAEAEEDLLLTALDHVLEHKGQREVFHSEHGELHDTFEKITTEIDIAKMRQLVKRAISASRKHFKHEEKTLFPLAEKTLSAETLKDLGRAFFQKHE